MTAKEKAENLVKRMQAQRYMSLGAATQCALICVDEILNNCIKDISDIYYWKEVKEQLKKL